MMHTLPEGNGNGIGTGAGLTNPIYLQQQTHPDMNHEILIGW